MKKCVGGVLGVVLGHLELGFCIFTGVLRVSSLVCFIEKGWGRIRRILIPVRAIVVERVSGQWYEYEKRVHAYEYDNQFYRSAACQ